MSNNSRDRTNEICDQNAEFLNVTEGGAPTYLSLGLDE